MFMGGHHLLRMVDLGKVRTFIWCRRCVGLGLRTSGLGNVSQTFVNVANRAIVLEGT